jgi:hypothetical protein
MSYTGEERRRHQRIGLQARAIVYASDRKLDCVAYNLSESGVLLLPPARARPGLALRVNVGIAGLPEWIVANAVLVREGEFMGRYAWGVTFTQLTPHSATLLRSYVRRTLRGETDDPQMSENAQPLLGADPSATATGGTPAGARPAPGHQARHLDTTGPFAPGDSGGLNRVGSDAGSGSWGRAGGRGRGIRPTAPQETVPRPEPAPDAMPGRSDEYTDPFADLPTAGAKRTDVDEHGSREIDIPTGDGGDWEDQADNVNLSKLYKEALDDVTPKEKKKKGWFG